MRTPPLPSFPSALPRTLPSSLSPSPASALPLPAPTSSLPLPCSDLPPHTLRPLLLSSSLRSLALSLHSPASSPPPTFLSGPDNTLPSFPLPLPLPLLLLSSSFPIPLPRSAPLPLPAPRPLPLSASLSLARSSALAGHEARHLRR
eukprot:2657537-Rhodomonas_salina.6